MEQKTDHAIERVLGCPATGRNLRTAREIAALLA